MTRLEESADQRTSPKQMATPQAGQPTPWFIAPIIEGTHSAAKIEHRGRERIAVTRQGVR